MTRVSATTFIATHISVTAYAYFVKISIATTTHHSDNTTYAIEITTFQLQPRHIILLVYAMYY